MFKLKKLFITCLIFFTLLLIFAGVASAESTLIGTVTADVLNFRESPDLDGNILLQLLEGAEVFVLDTFNGWYKVSYNEEIGWVFGDYLDTIDKSFLNGIVVATDVNVRSGPSTDDYVVGGLNKGDEIKITGRSGKWYSFQFEDGLEAFVYGELIRVSDSGSSRSYTMGTRIVEYSKNLLGTAYHYGGNSPSQGLDCSGFVKYVYDHFDIKINRVACDQATQGEYIERSALRIGDLVFFDTNGNQNYINHVGIYIGNDQFIHASSGKGKVVISDLSGFYLDNYMTGRKFVR